MLGNVLRAFSVWSILCLCRLAVLQGQVQPRHPGALVTDRPDQTESASIVPAGFLQLEAGWTWDHELDGEAPVRVHTVPALLARAGVSQRLEVRFGFSGFRSVSTEGQVPRTSGLGDMELGLKYRLLDGGSWIPEFAFITHVSIPTGAEGLSSERAAPSVLLALASALSERVSLGYNLGSVWSTVEDGSGRRIGLMDLIYTATVGISLADRLGAFLEFFGAFAVDEGRADSHSLDGGFTYRFSDNFQLDGSAGLGLNRAASDWFVGAGIAVRLPR